MNILRHANQPWAARPVTAAEENKLSLGQAAVAQTLIFLALWGVLAYLAYVVCRAAGWL